MTFEQEGTRLTTEQIFINQMREEIATLKTTQAVLAAALYRSQELFEKALPRFNWKASALNAEAIRLLNEVPGEVAAALRGIDEYET